MEIEYRLFWRGRRKRVPRRPLRQGALQRRYPLPALNGRKQTMNPVKYSVQDFNNSDDDIILWGMIHNERQVPVEGIKVLLLEHEESGEYRYIDRTTTNGQGRYQFRVEQQKATYKIVVGN